MDRQEDQPTAHEQTNFGLLSRTWELELLISGALVFALMQVPGHLDRYWDRIIFDVGPAGFSAVLLTHIYVRAIVVVLIVAFLLNLGARAYWVGLVGLDIVREPYVRLVIPYLARRDTEAVERLCPDAAPLVNGVLVINPDREPVPDDAAMRTVLDCIASYRDVRLNGASIELQHQFFREPRHGMEGTVVYIPVADLPAGQHLITVNQTPRWDDGAASGAPPRDPRPPYRIPFWR